MEEIIKFAIPILVAAFTPIITIWITHNKDKKETRDRYNEKRMHDFLSLCADYMSIAKAFIFVFEDNATEKMDSATAGINKAEAKLRLLSYFPIKSEMRTRLDSLSMDLDQLSFDYSRANEETRLFQKEYGRDDPRTHQKKDEAIELSRKVTSIHIKLETLFIEREEQLRQEWLKK